MKELLERQIERLDDVLQSQPENISAHIQMQNYIKFYIDSFGWDFKDSEN